MSLPTSNGDDSGVMCSKYCVRKCTADTDNKAASQKPASESMDTSKSSVQFSSNEVKVLRTMLGRGKSLFRPKAASNGNGCDADTCAEKTESVTKRRKVDCESDSSSQRPAGLSRSVSEQSGSSRSACLFNDLDYAGKLNDALESELYSATFWLLKFDELHNGVGSRFGNGLELNPWISQKFDNRPLSTPFFNARSSVSRWSSEVCRVKRTVKVQIQRTRERAEQWTPQEQAIVRVLLRRKPVPTSRRFQEALGGSRTEAEIERFIANLLATETRL